MKFKDNAFSESSVGTRRHNGLQDPYHYLEPDELRRLGRILGLDGTFDDLQTDTADSARLDPTTIDLRELGDPGHGHPANMPSATGDELDHQLQQQRL
ncbi:MAG: hypothetical protein V4702_04670 [Patescibacteria group bacterium]